MVLSTLTTQTNENATGKGGNLDRNPSFLIVGCPRSGLSLLGRLLDAHPLLAVAPDIEWLTKHFETRDGLNLDGVLACEPVTKWLEQKRFDPFEIPREDIKRLVEPGKLLPYKTFLTRLLELFGKTKGKRRVGSIFARLMPLVASLWPNTKFVHLIRDGRAVGLSVLNRPDAAPPVRYSTWREDPICTSALWWKRKVQQDRNGGRVLSPERYYEIRYESLVVNPIPECQALCTFLGVPFDEAMLQLPEDQVGERPGIVGQLSTAGLRAWSTQLSQDAIERFESVAGHLLDELGYPCVSARPSEETRQWVAGVSERFTHESRPPWLSEPTPAQRRQQTGATNPFVFIVGCPRSGTTLLQRLVNSHPDVAISGESFWIPYYFKKRIGVTPDGMVTPELVRQLFNYFKFYRMKIAPEELDKLLDVGQPVSYARFVAGIFDLYGEIQGKPLAGDKTPDYARDIASLSRLWPKAKFIHLIRDGRDVCLSVLNWQRKAARFASLFTTWQQEPVATAAAWWRWHVRRGRDDGAPLGPDRYYEIRYESLVNQPAEECAKLCKFLGLPFADAMLRFHEGRTKVDPSSDPRRDAKNSWLPVTPALRDWTTQMRDQDVECFESLAGDLLQELGYPRAHPSPRLELRARAAFIWDRFAEDARLLGEQLP
jgi:LPS sulfotransferase NodH